jgi:hypothetical protein
MQSVESDGFADLRARDDRTGTGEAQFQSIALLGDGEIRRTFAFGQPFVQKFDIKVNQRIGEAMISSIITTAEGVPIYRLTNIDNGLSWVADVGDHSFTVVIDKLMLYPGTYSIELWIGNRSKRRVDYIQQAIKFNVIQDTNSGLNRVLDDSEALVFQRALWKSSSNGMRRDDVVTAPRVISG